MQKTNHKNKQKMTIGIILLSIFLIWSVLSTIFKVLLRPNSVEIQILSMYNLELIGYLVILTLLILNILSVYVILSRKKWCYKLLISFFILNIIITLIILFLGINNLDLLKQATILSRTERGLPVDKIDMVVNPITIVITALLYSAFYLALIYYVYKKKNYFLNHNANSNKPRK